MKLKLTLLTMFFLGISWAVSAQRYTVHGYVKDAENGEALIGANVIIKGTTTGTVTNVYGFYSLSLPKDEYILVYSYMGFADIERKINLNSDQNITIELGLSTEEIEEVLVAAEAKNHNIMSTRIGVEKMDNKTIEKIPVLMGETDVIKALKLLPGVVSTSEMSSNLSVRGGAYDQNLILLDEANVYNGSHLLGLFSVFNNDAIKSVEMYKGVFPAQYGGRLSSLVDIRMKEGNSKKFRGAGSVGLLTSKLTLEAPVVKDKASVLLSARRTYIDLITGAASKFSSKAAKFPYFFHDYYLKTNYTINDKHRVYASGYFGRDAAKFDMSADNKQETVWGNYTGTLRWNYMISNRLFSNFTLITSNYDYLISVESKYGKDKERSMNLDWDAYIKDYSVKSDFNYFLNPENNVKFGAQATYHDFNVGNVKGNMDTMNFSFSIPKYYSMEYAAYISNIQNISEYFTLEYGLRGTMFQNFGKATVYGIKDYKVVDTTKYKKHETFNTYFGLAPRLTGTFIINDKNSIKAGYARTYQYLHVASNSNSGTPLDVWMPVSPYTKPLIGDQVTAGYFANFFDHKLNFSVEGYYKLMQNQIEFKEFSQPYFNQQVETDFRFGKGRAYGMEVLLKKPEGKFSGWVSYTLAKSERKIKDIQEKDWFPSPYDHRHNLSVVAMYDIFNRLSLSANWVFLSGKPFDAPSARWTYNGQIFPYYNGKNASRYPNYHRLDLGLEFKNKKKGRYESSWTFSVYNLYNRKNANLIYFEPQDDYTTQAYRFSMMQRIYAFSYNFKF